MSNLLPMAPMLSSMLSIRSSTTQVSEQMRILFYLFINFFYFFFLGGGGGGGGRGGGGREGSWR